MKISHAHGHYVPGTYKKRFMNQIDSVMFHRNDVGETAEEIVEWYKANAAEVGSPLMPYSFVIRRDGMIEQALPLEAIGPHGRDWNRHAIGVTLVGDFRTKLKKPPSSSQIDASIWLLRRLFDYARRPLKVVGHSISPGASKWGSAHDCPGNLFPMQEIIDGARAYHELLGFN
jgi:hypothetical protein